MARIAREVRDVRRVIGRKPQRSNFMGKAQPTEVLHRAGLRRIGLRVERSARLCIDQEAGYAATAEFVGQHQAAWAAAGDQNGCCVVPRVFHVS